MRIFYLLILLLCLSGHLAAQQIPPVASMLEKRVSLSVTGVELEKVLQQLSHTYVIHFSYSSNVIPIHDQISVNLVNQPLGLVLQVIFEPRAITYSTLGNRIVLRRVRTALEQTVRGTLIDQASKAPIPGANVIIVGSEPALGTTTDEQGNFRLNTYQWADESCGYRILATIPILCPQS